jgi:hypothetical protein
MLTKKRLLAAATLLAGFLSASTQSTFANTITPGQSGIAPDIFNGSLGSPASTVTSTGSGNLSNGATYTDYVIKGNVYGANDLSYVFVLNAGNAGAIINSLSYSSFAGLTQLDVGICENITNGGGCTGQGKAGTAPTSIAWSADGSTVTFTYPGLTGSLNFLAGIIMTNSENFVRGANICMNGNVCSGGFQPAHAPGPIVGAGLPGLVMACGGLLALARRRRRLVA